MNIITIHILQDASPALFESVAGDCEPYQYDLMVNGLDAEITELITPKPGRYIPNGVIRLEGQCTEEAQAAIDALPWVQSCYVPTLHTPIEAEEGFAVVSCDDDSDFLAMGRILLPEPKGF